MKSILTQLCLMFCHDISSLQIRDARFETVISQFVCDCLPRFDEIIVLLNRFPNRDKVLCRISESESFSCSINKTESTNEYICDNIELYREFYQASLNEETYTITIIINKTKIDDCISVYNLDSFILDLETNLTTGTLEFFQSNLEQTNCILLHLLEDTDFFLNTSSITFSKLDNVTLSFDRKSHINCVMSNISSMMHYQLLPDDFHVISASQNVLSKKCSILFSKLEMYFSLSILANKIDKFISVPIHGEILGYRTTHFYWNPSTYTSVFFKIYQWIFSDDTNALDKILLARNSISLQCQHLPIDSFNENDFESIKNNYNLYIKKHVEQYIAIKEKITEYIANVVLRINSYTKTALCWINEKCYRCICILFFISCCKCT